MYHGERACHRHATTVCPDDGLCVPHIRALWINCARHLTLSVPELPLMPCLLIPVEHHPAILQDGGRAKGEMGKCTLFREGFGMPLRAWQEPASGPRPNLSGLGTGDQVPEADGLSVPSASSPGRG